MGKRRSRAGEGPKGGEKKSGMGAGRGVPVKGQPGIKELIAQRELLDQQIRDARKLQAEQRRKDAAGKKQIDPALVKELTQSLTASFKADDVAGFRRAVSDKRVTFDVVKNLAAQQKVAVMGSKKATVAGFVKIMEDSIKRKVRL